MKPLTRSACGKMTRGQRRAARRAALTAIRIVQHAPTIEGFQRVAELARSADQLVGLRAAMAVLRWADDA